MTYTKRKRWFDGGDVILVVFLVVTLALGSAVLNSSRQVDKLKRQQAAQTALFQRQLDSADVAAKEASARADAADFRANLLAARVVQLIGALVAHDISVPEPPPIVPADTSGSGVAPAESSGSGSASAAGAGPPATAPPLIPAVTLPNGKIPKVPKK